MRRIDTLLKGFPNQLYDFDTAIFVIVPTPVFFSLWVDIYIQTACTSKYFYSLYVKGTLIAHKTNLKVERRKKTARKIMVITRELFSQKGYARTSAEEIVEAAGVTRVALYHHFDGKKKLRLEVVKSVHQEILVHINERTDREPDLFKKQIVGNKALLEAASRQTVRQILLVHAPAVLGCSVWRQLDEKYVLDSYKTLLQILPRDGLIKPVPVEALAYVVSGAANEGVFFIAEAQDPNQALTEVQETMAALIESLKP